MRAIGYESGLLLPTKYLRFEQVDTPPGRKTAVWNVISQSSGAILGTIRWHGPWRQYTLWPTNGTLYNVECLTDLADRLATCNRWHRNIRANLARAAS